ncbi:MAG: 30S ribosomal protein S7 [Patescibacteria group bacterium]|nr:30S ribosomal protein S7 [Patescibacteria group bacterium]MDE2590292.1 30S ribosomal protein S7 [Patescibacteria group bacterium]
MRHKKAPRRIVQADAVYDNVLVAKLINKVMKDGKKTVAQKVVYDAFDALRAKGLDPVETFEKALSTIAPKVELKARRIGGANYQVPIEVRPERRNALAIRWLLEAVRNRPNTAYHTTAEKLVAEVLDAIDNKGEAIKKRDNTIRQAEANKAFAHFRW